MGLETLGGVISAGCTCLGSSSATPLRATGSKHPKTTCFRGACPHRYPRQRIFAGGNRARSLAGERGSTLFKGHGESLLVCRSARLCWLRDVQVKVHFPFFLVGRVLKVDFRPIAPGAAHERIKPLATGGSITISESSHRGLFSSLSI